MAEFLVIGAWISGMILFNSNSVNSLHDVSNLTPIDIVTSINNGDIPLLKGHPSYQTAELEPSSGQITDLLREYKDMMTALIVDRFISSDESMFNFLKLVYGTFHSGLEEYKRLRNLGKWDIFFVYKGGNVLRIIANDFTRELPGLASKKINRYYEKFFKRSDADFSIYVRPTLADYDKIYDELITLSYYLQVKIRQEITTNSQKYFEFCKYTVSYQESILKEYHDLIVNSSALQDPANASFYNKKFEGIVFNDASFPPDLKESHPYSGRRDVLIKRKEQKNGIYDLSTEINQLYISANETLDFQVGTGRIKFALVRTKVTFDCYFDGSLVKIGGELIDVSIPHRLDSNVEHFFGHTDYVNQYQLEFQFADKLVFYSYTLKYLISDLEYILFKFSPLPWETPKYEKRLNRLFYLYFIDMFVYMKGLDRKKTVIGELKKVLAMNTMDIPAIIEACNKLQILDKLALARLPKELIRICTSLLNTIIPTSYTEMTRILSENCDFILSAFEGIDDFCSAEGNINMRVLYNNDFSSLIGGGLFENR